MSRPKSIPWAKRVSIFLAYRRLGGKVNPVAKNHAIARSTVTAIVNEFKEMGFSGQPRAKVSLAILGEMQDIHVQSILRSLGASGHGKLTSPQIGYLNLGPGTSEEGAEQAAKGELLFVEERLSWHLRGTSAEGVIQEARGAAHDYLEREANAWRELRQALEEACGVKEREAPVSRDKEPHLLPALVNLFRREFFRADFQKQPPPPSWFRWDIQPDEPLVLRLFGEHVAVGDEQVQGRIKTAVTDFLANKFRVHQRQLPEVEQLRQDLGLLQGIVNKAVSGVQEEVVRRGVCLASLCPEAGVETEPEASITKRDA